MPGAIYVKVQQTLSIGSETSLASMLQIIIWANDWHCQDLGILIDRSHKLTN